MKDIKVLIDAVKQLNQVWVSFSKKQVGLSKDLYDVYGEIEDAISNLICKVVKACNVLIIRHVVD